MEMASGRSKLNVNGRIVIPADVRRELGLEAGVELNVSAEDGRVVIETRENLLRRIQAEVKAAAGDRSLVDELIAERRIAFEQEERELEEWTHRSS